MEEDSEFVEPEVAGEVELVRDNIAVASPQEGLVQFEAVLTAVMSAHELPTDKVFVASKQRVRVLTRLGDALEELPQAQRKTAVYLSKFVAAVGAGLFDAALNYLWDETIAELRRRVAAYDLTYFFDTAVKDPAKRKALSDEDDLSNITDFDLIAAAAEMELISDLGYRQLDLIRHMRNWASAAHPNQNDLTANQLITWVETCVMEVIALPETPVVAEKKRLLKNIRTRRLGNEQLDEAASFFSGLKRDQADSLSAGLFGIFCHEDTGEDVRDNVRVLFPKIWDVLSEDQRSEFGGKYGRYAANGDQKQAAWARELLDRVGATAYLPTAVRAGEISAAADNLLSAHRGWENFYNEPPQARLLENAVGGQPVPAAVQRTYVNAVVEAFLTNGSGVAWNAEPIYERLITGFDQAEANRALMSIREQTISSRLQMKLPRQKFDRLLELIGPKLDTRHQQVMMMIQESGLPVDKAIRETRFKKLAERLDA